MFLLTASIRRQGQDYAQAAALLRARGWISPQGLARVTRASNAAGQGQEPLKLLEGLQDHLPAGSLERIQEELAAEGLPAAAGEEEP